MLSKNPQAVKRRETMMRKLGWDGQRSTYSESLSKYRSYMAGIGAEGGEVKVAKGFAMTRKKVVDDEKEHS